MNEQSSISQSNTATEGRGSRTILIEWWWKWCYVAVSSKWSKLWTCI